MKVLLVLCLTFASTLAQWPFGSAIRVRWGPPGSNSNYLMDIPRQQSDIIKKGWVKTARPAGAFLSSLVMYCSKDDLTLCACYDDTGFIAGLQINLLVEEFINPPIPLKSIGFIDWLAPDGKNYVTQQQYFVSEESLKKSPALRIATRTTETLQEGGIWVPGLDGKLLKIDQSEKEMAAGIWKKQACIPFMGLHYYYNMTTETTCDAVFPWFGITRGGDLMASGFMTFGEYKKPAAKKMWFEQPPVLAVKAIVPRAPQCLYDLSSKPGVLTMHIYYSKHPWTDTCLF